MRVDGRGVAWVGYVPVPGLFLVPLLAAGGDRFARYHAWQSGVLVLGTYVLLMVVGLLGLLSDAKAYRTLVGFVAGVVLIGAFVQMVLGMVGTGMRRYPRLRPAWDVVALLRRS